MADENEQTQQEQPGEQNSEQQTQQQQPQAQQQARQSSQQAPANDGRPPQGYVPVGEVAKERKKAQEATTKLSEAEQKVKTYEQREEKRKFMRDALGTLGQGFTIEKPEDLEAVVEALSFDETTPDNTKAVIAKLVEQAKRPVRTGPTTPMFGSAARDQNTPVDEGPAKTPSEIGRRMQAKLGITTS